MPANANSDRFSHFSHFVCLYYMPRLLRKMVVSLYLASSLVLSVAYSTVILLHEIILVGTQKNYALGTIRYPANDHANNAEYSYAHTYVPKLSLRLYRAKYR